MMALLQKLVSCSPAAMKAAMKGGSDGALKTSDVALKPTPTTAETIGQGTGAVPPSKAGLFVTHIGGWTAPKFVSCANERATSTAAATPTAAPVSLEASVAAAAPPIAAEPTLLAAAEPAPPVAIAVPVGQGTGEVPSSKADLFVTHVGGWSAPKFVSCAPLPAPTGVAAGAAVAAPSPPAAVPSAPAGRRSEYFEYWAPVSFVDSALSSRKAFEESLLLPDGERCMLEREARLGDTKSPPQQLIAPGSAAAAADLD